MEESFAEGSKNCRQFPGAEALNAISRRPVGWETLLLDECVCVRVCVCVDEFTCVYTCTCDE